jgi:hypothetical protein
MSNNSSKYLIDTNSFITPYKTFYSFDIAASFWDKLQNEIIKGNLIVLDLVRNELCKVDDELSSWIKKIDTSLILTTKNPIIVKKYSEILAYIQTSGFYKETALAEWARADIADAWLIAAAATYDYTIITFEAPNGNLNIRNKSRMAKIPDVCSVFGVTCENLYYLMRQLSIKL